MRNGSRWSVKQAAKRCSRHVRRSTSPSSSAPPSLTTCPPSKRATTSRRKSKPYWLERSNSYTELTLIHQLALARAGSFGVPVDPFQLLCCLPASVVARGGLER